MSDQPTKKKKTETSLFKSHAQSKHKSKSSKQRGTRLQSTSDVGASQENTDDDTVMTDAHDHSSSEGKVQNGFATRTGNPTTVGGADLSAIHVITVDVGQGECAIVRAINANGKSFFNAIIDGGFTMRSANLKRVLRSLEIRKIDLAVITHFDGDHADGLIDLIRNERFLNKDRNPPEREFSFTKVWVRTLTPENVNKEKSEQLRGMINSAKSKQENFEKIDVADTYKIEDSDPTSRTPSLVVTVLNRKDGDKFFQASNENDGSIAILFSMDDAHYYCAGDLGEIYENKLGDSIASANKSGKLVRNLTHF